MAYEDHIIRYLDGPTLLRACLEGVPEVILDTRVAPGKWSIREVLCHLTDFEIVYADRIKRCIAEDKPTLFGGDPDVFAERLAYGKRSVETELRLIEATRAHVAEVLREAPPEAWDRVGMHSERGPISVVKFVEGITNHIPHHLKFIEEKKQALLPS